MDTQAKPVPYGERTLFMAGVTFLGGFLDAYTYLTRGGAFANNHTGDMAKLGIMLAQGKCDKALSSLALIVCCITGALLSELVRTRFSGGRDWRVNALLAEMLALCAVAFVPLTVPNAIVNCTLSLVTGFQLCLFRTSRFGAHNTTIATGNLRSVGQFLFGALDENSAAAWSKLLKYSALVFSFSLGAAVGVPICTALGTYASLAGAALAGVLLFALRSGTAKAA